MKSLAVLSIVLLSLHQGFTAPSYEYKIDESEAPWVFHKNGQCNAEMPDGMDSDGLTINVGDTLTADCSLNIAADSDIVGLEIDISNGKLACGNELIIREGGCTSVKCKELRLTCGSSELKGYNEFWSNVKALSLQLISKSADATDIFEVKITPVYPLGKTAASTAGKIATWALVLIIIGAVIVAALIIGIPICICCGCCKLCKRVCCGKRHHHGPPVVYTQPTH